MALAGTLAFGGSAAAKPDEPKPNNVAAKQCQAEKHADKAAFEATYGSKHTMRECKRAHRGQASESIKNASQECRAEQEADAAAFAATYGTNGNAFGKCVSARVQADTEEDAAEFGNAAQQCREERAADPDAFAQTYGTNENDRNAFGKCVSKKAQAADEETQPV